MVVVLFRSMLTQEAGEDYRVMTRELTDRARSLPGFVDLQAFESHDGEHLLVVHWESAELLRAWSDDVRHAVAQRLGREKWYRYFRVEVAEVARSYAFDRPA